MSEVHGNFFLDECNSCLSRFIRRTASPTMALKVSDRLCPRKGRPCRGFLRDTILDWEDELPDSEMKPATKHILKSDLVLCLGKESASFELIFISTCVYSTGTTLQINPVGQLPFYRIKGQEHNRKVVIVNLQKTRFDKKADLVIHDYVDNVCKSLSQHLDITVSLPNDLTDFPEGVIKCWV